jgi:hypothetical protein
MVLLGVVLLCFVTIPTQADPDLWGHLRFGLDMLASHSIPSSDPYSYTAAGAPWTNHEWLAELLYALAWKLARAAGLVVLKVSLAVLTGALCYRHLLCRGVSSDRAAVVLLTFIALLPPFQMLRPLLFTIPAFAATLIAVSSAEYGSRTALWILPPLYAVWANLHGGFVAGLCVLGMWGVLRIASDRRRLWATAVPLAVTLGATCLTPYGWHLLAFLIKTASVPRPEIIEWEPLGITTPYGIMYAVVLGISVTGLALSRVERSWRLVVLFGVCALLPFAALRHGPLFMIAAVVLAGPHIADLFKRMGETSRSSRRTPFEESRKPFEESREPLEESRKPRAVPGWAPALPIFCVAVLVAATARRPITISIGEQFPVNAVKFLAASGFEGNLIHRFNWGEYLIWYLGPRVKVMVDGRRETVYPQDIYQQYLNFQSGVNDWDRLLRDHPADVALLERNSVSANLLRLEDNWTLVYQDDVAIILARRRTAALELLAKTTANPSAGPFLFP